MIIRLTRHAQDKMILFEVTKEQIKTTIKRGSKFKQTEGYLAVYGYLKVAYRIIGEAVYKIKTVYV